MESDKKNKLLAIAVGIVLIIAVIASIPSRVVVPQGANDKEVFTKIYDVNMWGGKGSGIGAIKENAIPFLTYLQHFIDSNHITSIVDIGCGDWELMKHINIPLSANYLGLDIVDRIIVKNIRDYAKNNIQFATVNNIEDLSNYKGDLLIIKDVMQHWNNVSIWFAINRIIPNFKYAILVNNFEAENALPVNSDIFAGNSRPLDLEAAPFFMKLRVIGDYKLPHRIKRMYLYVANDQIRKDSNETVEATDKSQE